jgi:ABC-type oligopeptide transport system substrate-binding subunit
MKHYSRWSMLVALLVVVSLVGVVTAQQPRDGGTLRIAWEQDVTGFDPHWSIGLQVIYLVGNLFNSLVTIDADLNMVQITATTLPFIQAAQQYVKGYVYERGLKIRFERTWLEK